MELHRCQKRGFEISQWLAEESGSSYSPQPCRQRGSIRLHFYFRAKCSAILKFSLLKCLVRRSQNCKWLLRNPVNSRFCLLLDIVLLYTSWVMSSSGYEELCSAFVQLRVACTLESVGTTTGQIKNNKPTFFLGKLSPADIFLLACKADNLWFWSIGRWFPNPEISAVTTSI